jgi:hypothetical protein
MERVWVFGVRNSPRWIARRGFFLSGVRVHAEKIKALNRKSRAPHVKPTCGTPTGGGKSPHVSVVTAGGCKMPTGQCGVTTGNYQGQWTLALLLRLGLFGGRCGGGAQALLHFFQAAGGFQRLQLPDHSGGGGAVIVLHPTEHHPCGIVVRGLLE